MYDMVDNKHYKGYYMTKNERLEYIRSVLSNHFRTCEHCNYTYMPMNEITNTLCPKCQAKDIQEINEVCMFLSELDD